MRARLLAWGVFLGVIYAAYQGVSHWRNPWAVPSAVPAVMSVLPDQPDGCGKSCQ